MSSIESVYLKEIFLRVSAGILSSNGRILPHPSPAQTGLLPGAHGPLHRPAGPQEGGHEEAGFLPSSRGLLVALRRHHRVRLLLSSCRSVTACSCVLEDYSNDSSIHRFICRSVFVAPQRYRCTCVTRSATAS